MTTRELLEEIEHSPYSTALQDDERLPALEYLELVRVLVMPDGCSKGYRLTPDGRDLLHGASERRHCA